jgi:all-trans-retinol dehydrogenase (NAD+)
MRSFKMKSLTNRNVIITGAASGIGRQMAHLSAKERSNLAIIDINETTLKETVDELSQYQVKVHPYRCDLSIKDEIEETAEKIRNDFGQIDILVNNAGVISGKMIADLSYEEIRKTIDVNLMAVIWMTKQFMPEMMSRNSGNIVNISSAAGIIANPQMGDYCASKFGVIGFSDTLRREFRKIGCKNVKVLVVCPGHIETRMFEGFKQPWYAPSLKPEYVAAKVLEAIKKDKAYLMLPSLGWLVSITKLLPISFQDKFLEITGVTKAMDNWVARDSTK